MDVSGFDLWMEKWWQNHIANACNKIKLYCRNGIVPSVNLILTYETKESPLDIETIEQMIKEYFV